MKGKNVSSRTLKSFQCFNSEIVCLQDILQNLNGVFSRQFLLTSISFSSVVGAPLHLKNKEDGGEIIFTGTIFLSFKK